MRIVFACFIFLTAAAGNAATQNKQPVVASHQLNYSDLADFALASKLVMHVRIKDTKPLKDALAQGTPSGHQRLLVRADVIALLKAPDSQPSRVQYLLDVPVDSRGRFDRLKKVESLVFARPGRVGELQLIAPDSWTAWSEQSGQIVRAILAEEKRADSPPQINGIASAFYSAGSLPGEGETQIFLTTRDNRPASLTVQRRAGDAARWFASLGEVVDEGVSQPGPNTLLWYRLACFLPDAMPSTVLDGQPPEAADQVRRDYRLIRQALGPCMRARGIDAKRPAP